MHTTLQPSSRAGQSSRIDIASLQERIRQRIFKVGGIGMGYVGLPLGEVFAQDGFPVIGFDVDYSKVEALNAGQSYIRHIPSETIAAMVGTGRFRATTAFDDLSEPDAILICVPTPLNRHREPDMSYVEATARQIAPRLRAGQLVVLESTTYPGTTEDIVKPILEETGLKSGEDFYLAYSPEREDPGNRDFSTSRIPKVVGGDGMDATALAVALYGEVVNGIVEVRDTRTAEAVKLTENIFRSVNIALVNELKQIYEAMGIDIWEVIDAAKTKPFGFMPFYPGPGLGGHCIPIDPFYLTWKAREHELPTRFVELAGEINTAMPRHIVTRLGEELNSRAATAMNGARVLLVGLAYKKNVDDIRESPAFKLIEHMEAAGARVDYHDPYCPVIPDSREHPELAGRPSVALADDGVAGYDAVVICTDHDEVDYACLARSAKLILDTRNAMASRNLFNANVRKA